MRGKLGRTTIWCSCMRIIPAHAGQTGGIMDHHRLFPDHPRACGANGTPPMTKPKQRGSSPRMRGKRHQQRHHAHDGRIIPAHAGQTRRCCPRRGRWPDHPRACGANGTPPMTKPKQRGSSPRMRGKRHQQRHHAHDGRIIPAHAGQTRRCCPRRGRWPDHPRACGANLNAVAGGSADTGSSPRMRGKLDKAPCARGHLRIIPAHAGQTR